MSDKKLITMWYKQVSYLSNECSYSEFEEMLHNGFKVTWAFNHIDERPVQKGQTKPKPFDPKFKEQIKSWNDGPWAQRVAFLENGKVIPISLLFTYDDKGNIVFLEDNMGELR